jgi:hypothetical protein
MVSDVLRARLMRSQRDLKMIATWPRSTAHITTSAASVWISTVSLWPAACGMMIASEVFMTEQEKINRGRIWGYALGAIVFVVVITWKFATR